MSSVTRNGRRGQLGFLCLIMILAGWMRVSGLGNKSLWYDEVRTLHFANALERLPFVEGVVMEFPPDSTGLRSARPWWKVWTSLRGTTAPPLYFVMVRAWRHLFGEGAVAVRSLSVLWSLAAILLLFLACQILHGQTVALYASAFMTLAVPQVVYAQEARNYTMALATALGSCVALLRLQTCGVSALRMLGLTLGLLCLLLTHYFTVPIFAALGLYALSAFRRERRWWAVGAFATAFLLFLACWGPFLMAQWPNFRTHTTWLIDRSPGQTFRMLGLLAAFPIRAFLEVPGFVASFRTPSFLSIVIGGMAFCLLPLVLRNRRDGVWLWVLWTALPLAFLSILDLQRSTRLLAATRYSLIATPGVYVLVAVALTRLPRVWQGGLFMSVVLAGVLLVPQAVARVDKGNWRGIATYLDGVTSPGDVLVYESLVQSHYGRCLLSGVSFYMTRRLPTLLLDKKKPLKPETLERLKTSPAVWLVTPALSQEARDLLSGFTIEDRRSFGIRDEIYRMRWTGR